MLQQQNVHFEKKGPDLKNITFLHITTALHKFDLKLEAGYATK